MNHISLRRLNSAFLTFIALSLLTLLLASAMRFTASAQEYTELYAIYVDGEAVSTSEDGALLNEMLTELLESYTTDGTESAYFEEKVEVAVTDEPIEEACELGDVLTVVTVSYETEYEGIPYETEYVYTDDLYEGETEIAQEGKSGLYATKYAIYYENGVETEREAVLSGVSEEPTSEIVLVGTYVEISTGTYVMPASGIISSEFGSRSSVIGSTNHKGLDIASKRGTEVYASDGGTVIFAGSTSDYGNLIQIQHENGDVTYYGHLDEILVSEGDIVYQGDLIGLMGSTGQATGVHLHFELRIDGVPVDPEDYLIEKTDAESAE